MHSMQHGMGAQGYGGSYPGQRNQGGHGGPMGDSMGPMGPMGPIPMSNYNNMPMHCNMMGPSMNKMGMQVRFIIL